MPESDFFLHSPAFVVSFSHGHSNELVSWGVGYSISGDASLSDVKNTPRSPEIHSSIDTRLL